MAIQSSNKSSKNNKNNKKHLKLIVQIPAYNEEATIAKVIKEIPRKINGIDKVEVLVVDDGSKDKTSEEARNAGADYVIKNMYNQGLGRNFKKGIEEVLQSA
jgi:glycosyltransferase involved in cell wall biosynthesis